METGDQWIPRTKASNAELWCFLWSAPEWTIEQTIVRPVIWSAVASIMTVMKHSNDSGYFQSRGILVLPEDMANSVNVSAI